MGEQDKMGIGERVGWGDPLQTTLGKVRCLTPSEIELLRQNMKESGK